MDLAALRESIELENRADLEAAASNFGEASYLMRRANAIRRRELGPFDPNELRRRTAQALEARSAE